MIESLVADVAEEAPVHGQTWRLSAEGDALDLFERELPVRRRCARGDAELLFGVVEQLVPAVQQARDVRADGDEVPSDGLEEEHVVEAGRAEYLGWGELEQFGDVLHRLFSEVAVLLLGQVQQGNHRRTRMRVKSDGPARA